MIVPAVNFSSYAGYFAIIIGFLFGNNQFFWIGIALLCVILLFHLITLPVEFNASSRALKKIKEYSLSDSNDYDGAKAMLTAAALTYVASLTTTILQILRLILIHDNRRN
jgi:Zn-dependent membrane protease YugP